MMETEAIRTENPLGTAPVLKLIARFAIPSVIAMLVSAAYNITDQIFIGQVIGMYGNAATNVAFPTVTIAIAFSQLIGVGTAANFNINQGAKRMDAASRYVHTGISLMIIVDILVGLLIWLFRSPILYICGATENVYPLALTYLSITAIGLPFSMFTNSCSQLIRGDGSPRYSMMCTVIGAVINVFLDWLFMFPLNMGIRGAAIATITGQILSAALCIAYLLRFKALKIRFSGLRVHKEQALGILKLGIAAFINHTVMMLVNVTFNNVLVKYGSQSAFGSDIPLAVAGVVAKLNTIMVSVFVGTAIGCQPIWGYNLGARNYARVKETYWKAFGATLVVGIIFFTLFQLFPRQIVSIFGSGDELYYDFAERYMKVYFFMLFSYNVHPMTMNYFSGTGSYKLGIIMSVARQGLFMIPLLLLLPKFFGLEGVLYAGPTADTLALILSFSLILYKFRHLGEEEELPT